MIKSKRGAIELSITTIVVVVIGITLLTLGLIWINNIFDRLRGTTSGAFEKVDTEIEQILGGGTGNVISLSPSQVSLEQGGTSRVKISLANIDPDQQDRALIVKSASSVKNARTNTDTTDISCVFGDTGKTENSARYRLSSGFEAKVTLLVIDKGAALGTYICNFGVDSSPVFSVGYQLLDSLQIEVVR